MDFRELHFYNVALAKKLEVKWLQSAPENDLQHSRPFLSRNLSYIRKANESSIRRKRLKTMVENDKLSETRSTKKMNLLFDLFRHRTIFYNDALLSCPRRETRGHKHAQTQCAALVASVQDGKRKRSHTMDDPSYGDPLPDSSVVSSVRSTPEEQQMSLSWAEKLAANDRRHRRIPASINATKRKRLCSSVPPTQDCLVSLSPHSSTSGSNGIVSLDTSGVYRLSTSRAETPMFFHFLVFGQNGLPAAHVLTSRDRRCPLCNHDAVSDTGLVLHLNASHAEDTVFQSARSETGELHVAAIPTGPNPQVPRENERLKSFVSFGLPTNSLPAVPFVKCHPRKLASRDSATSRKKIRLLKEMGADDLVIASCVPNDEVPIRQYFRSKTYQPMVGGDWEVDSDDDSTTDQWLEEIRSSLLDEFSDLTSDEKKFCKLWNQFLRSHVVIADRSMPERVMTFIRTHFNELKENNLRNELVLHLHNLWDNGLVSSDYVVECMKKYDSLVS